MSVLKLKPPTRHAHYRPIDEETGFEVSGDFERFSQKNDAFSRSTWDELLKSKKAANFFQGYVMQHAKARKGEGYQFLDYALRNAAWHVATTFRQIQPGRGEGFQDFFTSHEEGWGEEVYIGSPEEASLRGGLITKEKFYRIVSRMPESPYKKYLVEAGNE